MNRATAIKLSSARAWRTYLGGKLLDECYGLTGTEDDLNKLMPIEPLS